MFQILALFWFIRTAKAILFWVYLWQMKEYHLGRFYAHFSTAKGKHLILNKLLILKIILLLSFWFFPGLMPIFIKLVKETFNLFGPFGFLPFFGFLTFLSIATFFPFLLLILYLLESIKAGKDFFQKKIKKPVLTKKTGLILFLAFLFFALVPFFLWQRIYHSQIIYDFPPLYNLCFWLLLVDILAPLIISLLVLFFQPIAVFWRNKIIKKAKEKRGKFKNLLVIGITGSYGKTSTKEFLYTILSEKFNENKVLKTKEHQNSEIGISQCILNDLKPDHEIFICEMGAYNRGGIKLLCDIAQPKIGILTGINEQHLATFGSQENIIRAKFELIESLPKEGIAILNGDNKHISNLKTQISNLHFKSQIFYSVRNKSDVWAEEVKVWRESIAFKVFSKDGESADFRMDLLGGQNVENILAAASAAKELGMGLKEISAACQKIAPMPGAGKLLKTQSGINIIDATYSANPESVIAHLDYLRTWTGKKVIIMPCLIELGSASKDVHQRIGDRIGQVCDLAIITTKECFDEIKNSAVESRIRKRNILFIENPKTILEKIKSFCEIGDTILLESRVPKELIEELLKI